MDHKRRKKLGETMYQRVTTAVEALLFPPTLNDVVEGMGNTTTGVEARVRENMLELHAVACDAEAARRALGLGVREANLLAERLSLPLVQEMPVSVRRYNEAGNEFLAFARYRLAESAVWPGDAPDGWKIAPGPVVEYVEGNDRGRIVYHGNAIRPYMLYVYPGNSTVPAAIQTFNSVQEATSAFGPMLRQTKAKVSAPERTSEAGRAVEAYWSGDDRRGYVMLFKNFELYVHPVDGGFWNALAIWPNESEEAIGRFRDKNTAMNAAATWANKNAGKPPKQSRLAGF